MAGQFDRLNEIFKKKFVQVDGVSSFSIFSRDLFNA